VSHREWVERVCGAAGVVPHLPLWEMEGEAVLASQLSHGIRAVIVTTRDEMLSPAFLGRTLDEACSQGPPSGRMRPDG